MDNGLYSYSVPPGQGDSWYQYVHNGDKLTAGTSYNQQKVRVDDGAFISRFWAGQESICAGNLMLYDKNGKGLFAPPGVNLSSFTTGANLLPEVEYDPNSFIRFDLGNAQPTVASTDAGGNKLFASQLVFSGVRRRPNGSSDPEPSAYDYYEKPFGYSGVDGLGTALAVNNYGTNGAGVVLAPIQYLIQIRDFDFELRRVELQFTSQQGAVTAATAFKITLYDNYWQARSNFPVLASRFFHFNPADAGAPGQLNFFPSPPILYKLSSVIRFDIWSLLSSPTALPQSFDIFFHGVRRIPCK